MNSVIEVYDIKILEGHRAVSVQKEMYAQGRTKPGNIITNIDGVRQKGKHNYFPALAVDVVPYPIDWNDRERFVFMAGIIKGVAHAKGIKIRWGGDWDQDTDLGDRNVPMDLPHIELVQ